MRVERSGHDVVKKASELEVEKPGPAHGNGDGAGKGGVTQNDAGKDVASGGKPDEGLKAEHAAQKTDKKAETKTNGRKSATPAPPKPAEKTKPAEKPKPTEKAKPAEKPKSAEKPKPAEKAKAAPKPKGEKQKRKAATESGEPRRSKRIRGGE